MGAPACLPACLPASSAHAPVPAYCRTSLVSVKASKHNLLVGVLSPNSVSHCCIAGHCSIADISNQWALEVTQTGSEEGPPPLNKLYEFLNAPLRKPLPVFAATLQRLTGGPASALVEASTTCEIVSSYTTTVLLLASMGSEQGRIGLWDVLIAQWLALLSTLTGALGDQGCVRLLLWRAMHTCGSAARVCCIVPLQASWGTVRTATPLTSQGQPWRPCVQTSVFGCTAACCSRCVGCCLTAVHSLQCCQALTSCLQGEEKATATQLGLALTELVTKMGVWRSGTEMLMLKVAKSR